MSNSILTRKRQPEQRQALRAAEFFAGIGLVRLAIENHGWKVVFANDIDPDKREMYQANFKDDHFKLGDIHKLRPIDVPPCDLFTASFPKCDNDFIRPLAGGHFTYGVI